MQTGDTLLIHNAHLHGAAGDAVLVHGGRIEAVGAGAVLRARAGTHTTMIDAEGRLLTPGLIDCHTHLVYAGNRANEFALRAAGASYAEIAQAGGGIRATMHAVRAADEDMLIAQSLARLDALIGEGVMRVEIKSGYGLDLANERKMLRVARRLGEVRPVSVTTTFLGAHALPPEFASKDAYIDTLCADWLPALTGEGLVDAVDGFCERIAFSPAQIARLFDAAAALGLPVKLHAEQLSNQGGAALAARHKALSADHLEWLDEAGVAAMAQAATVAVMLPGAFYALGETRKPPVAALRAAGVPMAVATDCNPGTSPIASLLTAMNMAATLFGLSAEEALDGVTAHAARALGIADEGRIAPGAHANLCLWAARSAAELVYQIGGIRPHIRLWQGKML